MEGGMQLLNRDGHSISHNSKRHYHDSFVSMNRMRQRGLLCDIVLHVANKEIKAHKVVLASCSPYFHAMFTSMSYSTISLFFKHIFIKYSFCNIFRACFYLDGFKANTHELKFTKNKSWLHMVFKVYCVLFISDVYITSASFSSLSFLPAICHHHLMFFSHALFSSLSWSQISSCLVFPIARVSRCTSD